MTGKLSVMKSTIAIFTTLIIIAVLQGCASVVSSSSGGNSSGVSTSGTVSSGGNSSGVSTSGTVSSGGNSSGVSTSGTVSSGGPGGSTGSSSSISSIPAGAITWLMLYSNNATVAANGAWPYIKSNISFTAYAPNAYSNFTVVGSPRQTLLGVGGAFTPDEGYYLLQLKSNGGYAAYTNIMMMFFSTNNGGSGLTCMRTCMDAPDYSPTAYTYDDGTNWDPLLTNFNLGNDITYGVVQMIQDALAFGGGTNSIYIYSSIWQAPAWMAGSAGSTTRWGWSGQSGAVISNGTQDGYKAFADYFVKYIKAYGSYGIPIRSVAVGNEPENYHPPYFTYTNCSTRSMSLGNFIGEYLGPDLQANCPGVGCAPYDCFDTLNTSGYGSLSNYLASCFNASPNNQFNAWLYVNTVAYHIYGHTEKGQFSEDDDNQENFCYQTYNPGQFAYNSMLPAPFTLPANQLPYIMTEACNVNINTLISISEEYSHDFIHDLNAGFSGWSEWNFLHSGSDSQLQSVYIDVTTGAVTTNAHYFVINQESRNFRPGMFWVPVTGCANYYQTTGGTITNGIYAAAAWDYNNIWGGNVVMTVDNKSGNPTNINIVYGSKMATVALPPDSVSTFSWHQ